MKIKAIAFGLMISITGCTSTENKEISATQTNQSGFLSSYNQLKEVNADDDSNLVRYIKPGLKGAGYNNFILEPVSFYPKLAATDTISKQVLNEISSYANKAIAESIKSSANLVTQAGPNTARLKVAISSVEVSDKELSALQYIPIAFLVTAASGKLNDVNAQLRVEAELVDSQSGEVLMQAVKSGVGEVMDNDKTALTLDKLAPLLDKWSETLKSTIINEM
ncbi:DUF3313 domain-containing protein [Thalassotalea atypica]|uniref:DUF3313 domain-containing protein n=1 Tax=Thalassotalea atypica TaxID=2054316 RepID=UPI002572C47C|nr:DUF3313 domain-containing protein [Thalassotalea atypica]